MRGKTTKCLSEDRWSCCLSKAIMQPISSQVSVGRWLKFKYFLTLWSSLWIKYWKNKLDSFWIFVKRRQPRTFGPVVLKNQVNKIGILKLFLSSKVGCNLRNSLQLVLLMIENSFPISYSIMFYKIYLKF